MWFLTSFSGHYRITERRSEAATAVFYILIVEEQNNRTDYYVQDDRTFEVHSITSLKTNGKFSFRLIFERNLFAEWIYLFIAWSLSVTASLQIRHNQEVMSLGWVARTTQLANDHVGNDC